MVIEKGLDFMGGLHATEHAMIAMLPFLAMCDRSDVGGFRPTRTRTRTTSRDLIHDAYDGGMGLAEVGYNGSKIC